MPATYATLKLTRAWLTPVDNLTASLVVGTIRNSSAQSNSDGFVRQYASGRLQGVTTSLRNRRIIPLVLVAINSASIDWLYTNQGKTILYRSKAGERIFCQYFSFSYDPLDHVALGSNSFALPGSVPGLAFNVEIELAEVDYTEAVIG